MNTIFIILAVLLMLASYGGMHYYLYRKLRWIFPRHKKFLIISLSVLAVSLIVVQILSDNGLPLFLAPLAWLPAVWMGYVFLFFVIAGTADLSLKGISLVHKNNVLLRIKQATRSIVTSGVTIMVCFAGYISAQQINILSHTLTTPKLSQPVTIVQITDLHLGLLSSREHVEKLVASINALQPDIIVSTGDLVDMQSEHLDGFSTTLAQLRARLGKYAVYGNHEAYAGIDRSRVFTERAGFEVLSNQGVTLGQGIDIIGVDDPAVQGKIQPTGEEEKKLLEESPPSLYTLLLKHQPVVSPESLGRFDLQLSGHTHGGQIFPFTILVNLVYKAPAGLSKAGPSSWLYVSNGTGTWGPPMRVLARPEISVFYLQPETMGSK